MIPVSSAAAPLDGGGVNTGSLWGVPTRMTVKARMPEPSIQATMIPKKWTGYRSTSLQKDAPVRLMYSRIPSHAPASVWGSEGVFLYMLDVFVFDCFPPGDEYGVGVVFRAYFQVIELSLGYV